MRVYYLKHNDQTLGPYSFEELKMLEVSGNDYIWKGGFGQWMQAKDVEELATLFTPAQPLTTNTFKKRKRTKAARLLRWLGIIPRVFAVGELIF